MSIDLESAIVYNGHTSAPLTPPAGGGPVYGTTMRSVDVSPIPVAVQTDKVPLADGSTMSDAYLSGRTATLHGECWGRTPEEAWDYVELWMAAYSPRSPSLLISAPFEYSRRTGDSVNWPTGKIPMYMTASPMRQPWHATTTRKDVATGAHVIDVYAQLFIPDPYQYIDDDRQVVQVGTSATALPYRGKAPSYAGVDAWIRLSATPGPKITLTINSALSRPDIGYSSIVLDLSGLSANVTYDLSWATKLVKAASTAVGVIGAASIWGAITPGATASYAVDSGSGANLSYLKLLYPEAYF